MTNVGGGRERKFHYASEMVQIVMGKMGNYHSPYKIRGKGGTTSR